MITPENSEYFEHPIFLHILNRELHDAIGKTVDVEEIVTAIRMFSVVSSQTIFCNVSQIHEVLYDQPAALSEITELSAIGRFVAHSDYGSFDEFRESRAEKFAHSALLHPGFFLRPIPELKKLQHGSMGEDVSTTSHIEESLRAWLEGEKNSSLSKSLSQNDSRVLRENEAWIDRTLNTRSQKALTFDVFDQASRGPVSKMSEGAVRRALTEIYIDSYEGSYDARCLWGFRGKNHFERTKLLAGYNFPFASIVLDQVGITEDLRKSRNFGRMKRVTSDKSPASAYFRQGYAELASAIDSHIEDPYSWRHCNAKLTAVTQRLLSTGILRPDRSSYSYLDNLQRGGEVLNKAAREIAVPIEVGSYKLGKAKNSGNENTNSSSEIVTKTQTGILEKKQKSFFAQALSSFVVLVVLSAALVGFVAYFGSTQYLGLTTKNSLLISLVSALVGGGVAYWFHPDNFYRRHALLGLSVSAIGGWTYNFRFEGSVPFADGDLEIGNLPSTAMMVGGLAYSGLCIVVDAFSRRNAARESEK